MIEDEEMKINILDILKLYINGYFGKLSRDEYGI